MICPMCGGQNLRQDCDREYPFTYKGQTEMILAHGDWCPDCGEGIFDEANALLYEQQAASFKRKVDAESKSVIISVRHKLGLTQKEAGDIFGGGSGAFAAYELGEISSPSSLILLFKILERHPALLNEIRPRAASMDSA